MKRKSCLVIGYINNNLGDDLFFKILFERYPDVDFYFYPPSVLLEKYKKIYQRNKNVKFYEKEPYYQKVRQDIPDINVPINLFPMILERAKKVDFYINIGGSIFIQNANWKNDDRFIIKEHLGNKPAFIIGCNFGPGDEEFKNYYKEWFKEFDDICFRDKKSYNEFKQLKNVRIADDIVLSIKNNKVKQNPKRVAISVVNKDLDDNKFAYYRYLSKNISQLLQEKYQVNLFSFCENEGDMVAINEILKLLSTKERQKVKIINYKSNIDTTIKEWKKCGLVIGSRFHSIVLALANNQKFFAISYSKKIENYLQQYDENIKVLNIKDIKQNNQNIEFYELNREYDPDAQFLKIDELLKR